jgi:hypothetical protein
MIKFFRQIRQHLIMENKTSKYFKYALGEIVLVVLGILIALQINNWNENKKDKAYELKMLNELSNTIDKDLKYTKDHILGYRTKQTENSIRFFKRLIKNDPVDMDSMSYYFSWTSYGVSHQVNEGPYKALISVGLDKVSNDSLRNAIQQFYDFRLPRNRQLISWADETFSEQQKPLKTLFYDKTQASMSSDDVEFIRPLIEGEFWNIPDFIEYLRISQERVKWRRNEFEDLVKDLEVLKALIDKELESNA